jgi:beta-lactamase class C
MSSGELSGIQTIIDDYIQRINNKHPDAAIGVVIGAVTPANPAGAMVFSTPDIVTQGGQSVAPNATMPFELGSVSKVFTAGIYDMLQPTPNFEGTLGERLGSQMTMSDFVKSIPIQCLAAYASGFPQDNGHCKLHPSTGFPPGMASTLDSLFKYLASYDTPAYTPGTTYSYSNLAMSLVAMAALNLDSTDTDAFVSAFNAKLIEYCRTFGVDQGSSPSTMVYSEVDTNNLPVGYDKDFQSKVQPPCSMVEYGSGGIVSTGNDMLQFLRYCMSSGYPAFMQEYRWQHTSYCSANEGPITGYGWFIETKTIKNQQISIVSKDGGVAGFTSWIALEQRSAPGKASPRGLFILTNGPDATTLGRRAFGYLIPPASAPVDEAFLQPADPPPDPRVH